MTSGTPQKLMLGWSPRAVSVASVNATAERGTSWELPSCLNSLCLSGLRKQQRFTKWLRCALPGGPQQVGAEIPSSLCWDAGLGAGTLPSPATTAVIQAQPKRKMTWKDSTLGDFRPAHVPKGRLFPTAGSCSSSRRPEGCWAPAQFGCFWRRHGRV